MLYLPLDGDTRDHSGIGRHGQVAGGGQRPPSFTCLDKSVNCSALFTASQCVAVPSLAMTPYTSAELQRGAVAQVPKASFVVHFKRVPNGPPTKQGTVLQTWLEIYTHHVQTNENQPEQREPLSYLRPLWVYLFLFFSQRPNLRVPDTGAPRVPWIIWRERNDRCGGDGGNCQETTSD